MRCFLFGLMGAVLVLLSAAIIVPQYSDYSSLAQTSAWLVDIEPLQSKIEENAARKGRIDIPNSSETLPEFQAGKPRFFKVSRNGVILMKGGKQGQFVMLTPEIVDGKVVWTCIGGPDDAVPVVCRLKK
jgi:Tfp pilus assembly major pilin PilA